MGVLFCALYLEPLHSSIGLHSEECVLSLVALFATIVWIGDRNSQHGYFDRSASGKNSVQLLKSGKRPAYLFPK